MHPIMDFEELRRDVLSFQEEVRRGVADLERKALQALRNAEAAMENADTFYKREEKARLKFQDEIEKRFEELEGKVLDRGIKARVS